MNIDPIFKWFFDVKIKYKILCLHDELVWNTGTAVAYSNLRNYAFAAAVAAMVDI